MNTPRIGWILSALSVPAAAATFAQTSVQATVETAPVPSGGDAADDMVVWVHPTNRALSTIIGTDKEAGLLVYDLAGNVLQFLPDGRLNNVDLRRDFRLGASEVALVTSAERNGNVLAIYKVNASTRLLQNVAARTIALGIDVYGCCMYRSPLTGATFVFVTSEDGDVQQWRLFDNGAGLVDARLVRAFDVGDQSEGCVADDENGNFFVAEEDVGIWRYGAEPGSGTARVLVDHTEMGGHLAADAEGLAIYYARGGAGYLLASSQGDDSYAVYDRRAPHDFLFSFRITDNLALGIDGTTDTDGIDVMNLSLGPSFPGGVFVVQDGSNLGGNQNFKLVPWQTIAHAASPPLIVDWTYEVEEYAGSIGRKCASAEAKYRNGSGVNPSTLTNLRTPLLGTVLTWDLDCAGHAPATAHLSAYARRSEGSFGPWGETLVDPASARYFAKSAPHSGNTVRFSTTVPPDLALCGLPITLQGLCMGAPGPKLSNAVDIKLGF